MGPELCHSSSVQLKYDRATSGCIFLSLTFVTGVTSTTESQRSPDTGFDSVSRGSVADVIGAGLDTRPDCRQVRVCQARHVSFDRAQRFRTGWHDAPLPYTACPRRRTLGSAAGQSAPAGDWPQWQDPTGPASRRRPACSSSGRAAARRSCGRLGHRRRLRSVAIKGDRIFVQGSSRRQSVVYSLNRADGKRVWSRRSGAAATTIAGSGPRSTPTVDGDRVYVLTENGDLACLKAQDGTAVVAAQHPEGLRRAATSSG